MSSDLLGVSKIFLGRLWTDYFTHMIDSDPTKVEFVVRENAIQHRYEFGSQILLNIVKEVIEVDELNEGNISATAGKKWMAELSCVN